MEIMTLEFGFERTWSDNDALLPDGHKVILHDAALLGHVGIPGENVMISDCFERVWSDTDVLINTQSPRILKKVA